MIRLNSGGGLPLAYRKQFGPELLPKSRTRCKRREADCRASILDIHSELVLRKRTDHRAIRFLARAVVFWGLASVVSANSAKAASRFDSWTTETGLPQNSVNAILQTRDGYLWIATYGGLVRYDGVQFTVFDRTTTGALGSNRIVQLMETADGSLWAGCEDGGVTRYKDGQFTAYSTADGLPENGVWAFALDAQGDLLVVTQRGVVRWGDGKFVRYPYERKNVNGSSSVFYYSSNNQPRLLYEAGSPIALIRGELARQAILSMFKDKASAVWVGTKAGLYRIANGVATHFSEKDGVPDSAVVTYYEDRGGALWMGTQDRGLLRFKDGRFERYSTADGLSSNSIASIFQDREGTLWIGTSNHGLNRLKRTVITSFSETEGLIGKNAYPIYQERSGDIWIGCGGLHVYHAGKFIRYAHTSSDAGPDQVPFAVVTSLFEDRDGVLWVGQVGGLYTFKDGQFVRRQLLPYSPFIWSIYQSGEGTMWFGMDRGLLKDTSGELTVYTTADGLAGNDVKVIIDDRQGGLWVGTYGGLSHLKDGRFVSYTQRDGLPSDRVRSLYLDSDGVLWIGTYDGGLGRLKDNTFTRYSTRAGLFDDGVFQILDDDRGNLWMSSNRGVYRVSKHQLNDFAEGKIQRITCISYGVEDGMLNSECNGGRQPAGIRAKDGKLWFPTLDGVVVIDPEAVPVNDQPPPVLIEGVQIDRSDVAYNQGVTIAPGKQNLEIRYAGLSFIDAHKIDFRYKMEGLDTDWVDVGDRRTAYYSHLPAGTYTFKVIAANSDGIWNIEGQSLSIVVLPPIWRTWWFDTLAALVVAAALAGLYRRRVARLERTNRAQAEFSKRLIQSQESERKRIAAELHDGLGQNLLVIKNRALLGMSDPDDAGRAILELGEISSTASQAIDEVRSIAHNLRPYQLDRLGLTMALEAIVKKVGESSKIEFKSHIDPVDDLLPPEAEINLYRIVQEAINNVVKHSRAVSAQVAVLREVSGITVSIHDDGRGFTILPAGKDGNRGMGLSGIQERARIIGARLTVQSAPGQGTTIVAKVDLPRPI